VNTPLPILKVMNDADPRNAPLRQRIRTNLNIIRAIRNAFAHCGGPKYKTEADVDRWRQMVGRASAIAKKARR
jgi:hypothetical protein